MHVGMTQACSVLEVQGLASKLDWQRNCGLEGFQVFEEECLGDK